ncbi:hypothetical protein FOPG_06745 [Fusarium oxysporum f. sp. conglutinans race 2 54008]|uniref:Uncharacterized protein n=2 Tax=Fusarium oxysporum f. sp. conglutinans TaxID=100902 RepID=F9F647_FUSOF|nr:hypothetical protein FOXB_01872 [Fusarium oxysporum f. sp. conglutinans Fo5176]EXL79210.1 hypothetical protein FOPG_06745 [Fusarium oxysporum f. sp. conglutinans race 2 54008]KAG6981145.1 hypothetical protein FocnCong_v009117 [Fusarium oxysporum f. sp. conglutinans]KAI8414528.1 hypothetical protein FOFC_04140 [Fusarium oxysporum]
MAGPLQVGDLISLGRLAWEVYRYGWSEDHNATKQYEEFGRDVRGLAENLDILSRVVAWADNSLQSQRRQGAPAKLRWDRTSLVQIIGDYEMTLRECNELLRSNNRYRVGTNPLRNLEWNVLVQPAADQLRQRIMLHNSKILHVLKPFEVDLLLRVRQDIERMHQDLADRITAAHHDIRRLMGVLIPDLDEALDQRVLRSVVLLEVPVDLDEQFRFAALTGHPEYRIEEDFELTELSDAFILNFHKSTINFQSGMVVEDRVPTVDQYLNLLKCVWIFKRIQAAPALREADKDTSHWPSYARQLEDDLSSQCARFGRELVTPRIITSTLKRDMFTIWPEKEPAPLVDLVTKDEMMEQLLEVNLQSYSPGIEKKAKLLRRLDADGRRFRIIMSGSAQASSGKPRQQTEKFDFDITTMIFNSQYALPTGTHMTQEIILRQNERIARLDFMDGADILKFQQAVTGFKPWASATQYDCQVIFVLGGVKETIMENACLQLWIPKSTEGSLVTNSDAAVNTIKTSSSRQNSISTLASGAMPSSPLSGSRPFASPAQTLSSYGNGGDGFAMGPPGRHPSLPTIPQRQPTGPEFYGSWPGRTSPEPIGSSPVERQSFFPIPGPPRQSPPRKPVGSTPSPRRSSSLFPPPSSSPTMTNNGRSFSISSGVSSNSNSSNSDVRSVSISTGTNSTGLLHKRPVKPMLVLFTQNRQGDKFSFVTVQIDDETNTNPERCNCRRSGRDGASCDIAAIEKKKGDAPISARRYEQSPSDGEMDWNLARLALNNPASTSDSVNWPNLKRLSIKFPTPQARAKFCGTPNVCHCKIKKEGDLLKCIQERHRGLWGEVQENYRRQMNSFHKQRYESRSHVVYGVTS